MSSGPSSPVPVLLTRLDTGHHAKTILGGWPENLHKRALLIKLMTGREFKPIIEPVHRCNHTGGGSGCEGEGAFRHGASIGRAVTILPPIRLCELHALNAKDGLDIAKNVRSYRVA
jgi:hypothetical protein